jgi:hypothetical protein
VLEFAGGDGHRYLFPKFSVIQQQPGQQILASFLIIRRGSRPANDDQANPALDYWEPVTIRISGKPVDLFKAAVAPEEDVRRYMDGVKRSMTRAEFVMLAMRLPKDEGAKNSAKDNDSAINDSARDKDGIQDKDNIKEERTDGLQPLRPPPVIWTTKTTTQPPAPKRPLTDDDRLQAKYQKFIASVSGDS